MPLTSWAEQWPLWAVVAVLVVSATAIALAGFRLSEVADELADRTGLGEVIAGALFVGATTSLSGAVASVSAAAEGSAELAAGNALGGLTAQTAFVAIADLFYRKSTLEHAAASVSGLSQGVLFMILLTLPLLAMALPSLAILGVHPFSFLIVIAYAIGIKMLKEMNEQPMWRPVQTAQTRSPISSPEPERMQEMPLSRLWVRLGLFAAVTAIAGFIVAHGSLQLVARTPLSGSIVGTYISAIATSLPELFTAIAAVRIGAVSLAVADVFGGNAFDVMFLSAADLVYDGSIYDELTAEHQLTALTAMLMTAVFLFAMLRRERSGLGQLGSGSVVVLSLYILVAVTQFFLV